MMEIVIWISVLLAVGVGAVGLLVFVRRRSAEQERRRSEEMRALDDRISERLAGMGGTVGPQAVRRQGEAEDEFPIYDLLPVASGTGWAARLGLSRGGGGGGTDRRAVVRDTVAVAGVALVLVLVGSQLLPPATPPDETPTPSPTDQTAVLPSGTPNLLRPTPTASATDDATPSPSPEIIFETPGPTPKPTPKPTAYVPPGGGGGGGGGSATPKPTAKPTPVPTPTPDTQKPTQTGNFAATPVSEAQVDLTWTASTDNVGVVGYRIYRDGLQVALVTTLSHSVMGLSAATEYQFGIRAVDAAGNVSNLVTTYATTLPTPEPTPCDPDPCP